MNLFKKKYKKSKWFEGLLQAEELIKDGYTVNSILDEPLWFTKIHDGGTKMQQTIGYDYSGRKDGAIAYIEHYHNYLK